MSHEPKSLGGTVSNRPDERWVYVVERPAPSNPNGDPNGKWYYDGTQYDDQTEACNAARAITGPVRVRSFKHAHMPTDHGIHPDVFSSKPVTGSEVALVPFVCIDHPTERISVPASAKAPRCPTCHSSMVSPQFAASIRGVK